MLLLKVVLNPISSFILVRILVVLHVKGETTHKGLFDEEMMLLLSRGGEG